MRVVSLLLCLLLAGCKFPYFAKLEPADAHCDSICWKECEPLDKWDGTADQAAALVRLDGVMYQVCKEHAAACRECLLRLERTNVIKPH